MKIKVSNGELIDKLTILEIKMSKITDLDKLNNIRNEWELLSPKVDKVYSSVAVEGLADLQQDLYNVNLTLWNIEDQIRECERNESFGEDFIELARSVYYQNDERSQIKKEINILTCSSIVEEKSYEVY